MLFSYVTWPVPVAPHHPSTPTSINIKLAAHSSCRNSNLYVALHHRNNADHRIPPRCADEGGRQHAYGKSEWIATARIEAHEYNIGIFTFHPTIAGYPKAKFPGVVVFSEIYQGMCVPSSPSSQNSESSD
jgi:hypothetical protein